MTRPAAASAPAAAPAAPAVSVADNILPLEDFRRELKAGRVAGMPRKRDDKEHREQAALFAFLALWERKYADIALIHAIPNGANLSPRERVKITEEGRKRGIWDIYCPVPRVCWRPTLKSSGAPSYFASSRGLYVEMKIPPNTLTPEQEAFRAALEPHGYTFRVCHNWIQAAAALGTYLGIPDTETDFWRPLR